MALSSHGGQDIAEIEDWEYFCAKCEVRFSVSSLTLRAVPCELTLTFAWDAQLKKDPRTHDWSDAKVNEAIQEFRTLALFRSVALYLALLAYSRHATDHVSHSHPVDER